MKDRDLHSKQREEMRKQNVSSDRNKNENVSTGKEHQRQEKGRDLANEERTRSTSTPRP